MKTLKNLITCVLLAASLLPLAGFGETVATDVSIEEKFDGPLSAECAP
jgi:hypothetical protein